MIENLYYECQYWVKVRKEKLKIFKWILSSEHGLDYRAELIDEKDLFLCRNVQSDEDKVEILIITAWIRVDREYLEVIKPEGKAYITYVTKNFKDSIKLNHYYEIVAEGTNGYYIIDEDGDLIYYDSDFLTIIKEDNSNEYKLIDIIKKNISDIEFSTIDNNNKFMLDKDNRLIIYLPEEISSKCNKKRLVIDLNSICVIANK